MLTLSLALLAQIQTTAPLDWPSTSKVLSYPTGHYAATSDEEQDVHGLAVFMDDDDAADFAHRVRRPPSSEYTILDITYARALEIAGEKNLETVILFGENGPQVYPV